MSDKGFAAQIADTDFVLVSQRVLRRDDHAQLVQADNGGFQVRVAGVVGNHAQVDLVTNQGTWDFAGKTTLDDHLDRRVALAETLENREQIKRGGFIGAQRQLSPLEGAELVEGGARLSPQVQDSFRVLVHHPPGFGEDAAPGGAVQKGFSSPLLEPADCLADSRLRSEQLGRRTRKTLLFDYRHKGFELRDFHGCLILQRIVRDGNALERRGSNYKSELYYQKHYKFDFAARPVGQSAGLSHRAIGPLNH